MRCWPDGRTFLYRYRGEGVHARWLLRHCLPNPPPWASFAASVRPAEHFVRTAGTSAYASLSSRSIFGAPPRPAAMSLAVMGPRYVRYIFEAPRRAIP